MTDRSSSNVTGGFTRSSGRVTKKGASCRFVGAQGSRTLMQVFFRARTGRSYVKLRSGTKC
jgi:hypothetical protein